MWILAVCAGGCAAGLKQQNAELAAAIASLQAEQAELQLRVDECDPGLVGPSLGSGAYRFVTPDDIGWWMDRAWYRHEESLPDPDRFELPDGCDGSDLVTQLAIAKMFWRNLGAGRLVGHPGLIDAVEASWGQIDQRVSADVVYALLDYHDRVVGTPGWATKLDAMEGMDGYNAEAQLFWDAGFPASDDPCLVSGEVYFEGEFFGEPYFDEEEPYPDTGQMATYDDGHEQGYHEGFAEGAGLDPINQYWYDGVSAEFYLYSFWYRRHHEGTMELVEGLLRRLQ